MLERRTNGLAGLEVPQSRCLVLGCACEDSAIRRDCNAPDGVGVPRPNGDLLCQVVVFHVLIEESPDPEISVFPSGVQARQFTACVCPLRFATSLPVFASQILRYSSSLSPPPATMMV